MRVQVVDVRDDDFEGLYLSVRKEGRMVLEAWRKGKGVSSSINGRKVRGAREG